MNKLLIIPALLMFGGCASQTVKKSETITLSKEKQVKTDGLKAIIGLIETIKPILMNSMKTDSTGENGIDVCSASAQELTKSYNKNLPKHINIYRTALRYRNPLNKPDDIDKKVMNQIVSSNNISPIMIKTVNGYRVYKPLVTLQTCLACHGDVNSMNPKTVAKIKKYYPKDLATGFKLGDFRGVVVAEIKE